MTDSQLLLVLFADWVESDARLAPPLFLLYLALAPPGLKAHFLFLSAPDCCPRLNEAESRKNWELDQGLGPGFGLQINLEVEVLWSCSLLIFSWNWCGNKCLSVGMPSRKVRFPRSVK